MHLKKVLEARKYRSLTVGFPFPNRDAVIQSRFVQYTASRLNVSGNAQGLTVYKEHHPPRFVPPDTDEFVHIINQPTTKVTHSIYFALARWESETEIVYDFQDSNMPYRIRTGSRHSVENLLTAFKYVEGQTRAHFSFAAFELFLVNTTGVDGGGVQRTYPVFQFTMRPPGGMQLTSGNVRAALESGRRAVMALALPPIPKETAEDDARDAHLTDPNVNGPLEVPVADDPLQANPVVGQNPENVGDNEAEDAQFVDLVPEDLSERDLKAMQHNKDPEAMQRQFFAVVRGTPLENPEVRHPFLKEQTGFGSIKDAVNVLRPEQWAVVIQSAINEVKRRTEQAELEAKMATPQEWHPVVPERARRDLIQLVKHAPLTKTNAYPFFSMILKRGVAQRSELTPDDVERILSATGNITEDGWTFNEARTADLLMNLETYKISDESAEHVLG